ncbi:MAG: restriction endonuclease [Betaproteobacteria bacterium]
MHENSLFAVLLRSPWWISFLLAAGVAAACRIFIPLVYAVFAGLPFIVVGCVAAWRQLREPSAAQVTKALERAGAMQWPEFCEKLGEAFRREGYEVKPAKRGGADLELVRGGVTTLVAAKRWKATRTGVEPLKELVAAREASEASEAVYVAAGELTAQALAHAREKRIRVVHGAELAKLLR